MFAQLGYYICVPFAWLTRVFYSLTGSYGLALILFTLVVKLVILPFQLKGKKSMLRMNRMQGKMKDIQTRYANNKQRQQEEMANLYAQEGVNPMSGCLWSFLPFPILIALYAIIRQPLRYLMGLSMDTITAISDAAAKLGYAAAEGGQAAAYEQIYLAKFVHQHWSSFQGQFDGLINLDYNFLGMDLASQGSTLFKQITTGGWPVIGVLLLPVIATALQFLMTVVSMKSSGAAANSQSKMMMYLMPLMTLWMGYILPAALCVYWIANSLLMMLQEVICGKILKTEKIDLEVTASQKNALGSAQSYLRFMAFSYSGLVHQLEYEGYSNADATFAADYCGADWNEQAAKSAESYLKYMSFSRSSLIHQLEYEGFTADQATYGADAVGL